MQVDLRSNYERKSDGIGYLMKHAEIVGKRKHTPAVQVLHAAACLVTLELGFLLDSKCRSG